jgi:hypothetical protein
MRSIPGAVLMLGICAAPLPAQSLREQVVDLFRFGVGCPDPVCLSVGSAHGDHYNPAARVGQANLISFVSDAIGASASNIPVSAASSGAVWGTSASGLPVRTETSAGPIFAERAQTIGHGRMLVGANVSSFRFQSLRGVPMSDLQFNFTHQHDPATGPLGTILFQNDVIEVRSDLAVNLTAVTGFVTYGLLRWMDVSVAVPFVHTSLEGTSVAQVMPFTDPTPHFFGDPANPQLRATAAATGSASGIGDVAVRVKAELAARGPVAFAALADVRLPTGDEDDFLGAGQGSLRALGIVSGRYGNFSPHLNTGFWIRSGPAQADAFLLTAGFDQLVGGRVTFAADVISEWQLGETPLEQPEPVLITTPIGSEFRSDRLIEPSNIPDRRDNIVLATAGFKISTASGITVVTNGIVPVRRGGLQPDVAWTLGVEYSF